MVAGDGDPRPGEGVHGAPGTLIDTARLDWKTDDAWKPQLVSVLLAAVVGLVLVSWQFSPALRDGRLHHWVGAIVGVLLVTYALTRSLFAVFGTVSGFSPKLRNRWRIAWSVGALTVATLAMTSIAFAVNDDVRQADPFCTTSGPEADQPTESTAAQAPVDTSESPPVDTSESAPVDTSDSDGVATPAPPSSEEQPVPTEAFGFERGVRSEIFIVKASSPADADALDVGDFTVLADDGRAITSFARVKSVTSLTGGEASARLEIDLSCHSGLEGGKFEVSMVYRGDLKLDRSRWDLEVTLQSRLVFYALALIPGLVILAIYQVFDVWPMTLKRWFTNVLAIGAPVLAAFTAAGINNATWAPSLLSFGALIAATYTAAVAAATLVKNAGHDLADGSDPANVVAAAEGSTH